MAALALGGMGFDLIGGLYLAYDLLGKYRKPLRFLLRVALYWAIFGTIYAIAFRVQVALFSGFGLSAALATELALGDVSQRPARERFMIRYGSALFRAISLGVGFGTGYTWQFGLLFTIFSFAALALAYTVGFAPSDEWEDVQEMHLSKKKLLGSLLRGFLLGIAAIAASYIGTDHVTIKLMTKMGIAVAIVGILAGALSPPIEAATDRMPDRILGLVGVVFIALGMLLQSVQYWVVLLDIPVH